MATHKQPTPAAFIAYVRGVVLTMGRPDIDIQPDALAELYAAFTGYGVAVLEDAADVQKVVNRTPCKLLDPRQIRLAARLYGS
jgi:hypothetical protein